MNFNVITIFPSLITDYCLESILGRAQTEKLIKIKAVDLRDYATDKHKTIDDTPYGGGPGMVMKPEPIWKALKSLHALKSFNRKTLSTPPPIKGRKGRSQKTILLSPRGRQFDQRLAEDWSQLKEITFVCGRYEGVDERVADYMVDEEISVGPYVLAGGELGALIIIEAIVRLIPGVLGNEESLLEETFAKLKFKIKNQKAIGQSQKKEVSQKNLEIRNLKLDIFKEYPQYTKPAIFQRWKVPAVLLTGNHKKIAAWRQQFYPQF